MLCQNDLYILCLAEEFVLLKRPKILLQANKAEEFEVLQRNPNLIRQKNLICSRSKATFGVLCFPPTWRKVGEAWHKSSERPEPIHGVGGGPGAEFAKR